MVQVKLIFFICFSLLFIRSVDGFLFGLLDFLCSFPFLKWLCGDSGVPPTPPTNPPPAPNPAPQPTPQLAPLPPPPNSIPNPAKDTTGTCPDGYSLAEWTTYTSFPDCCPESPTYDPNAEKTECGDYSGCKFIGQFAYVYPPAILDASVYPNEVLQWVKSNNLVAMFDGNGSNEDWARRRLRLIATDGQTADVLIADTCGDIYCGGCCSKNMNQQTKFLVDIEYWTLKQHFGGAVNFSKGKGPICFKLL
jgi:hypothetical protein